MVVTHLKRIYPQSGFQLAILEDGARDPRIQLPPEQKGLYALPNPGTIVLVLGDLGCLARQQEQRDRLKRVWLEWGRRFQGNSNPALAIVPCHPNRCGDELARLWTILPWEVASLTTSSLLSDKDTAELTDQLLTRLAFALRVEPRLVRAVRRTLFDGRADAGIESYIWQHEAFVSRHHEAATFDPRSMHSLLPRFFRLEKEERRRIYELVRELRRDVYPGVWFSELLALERDVARGLLDPAELRQAAWWYQQRKRHLVASGAVDNPAANEPTWFRQVFARLPESVNQGIAARTLHEIEAVIRPDGEDRPEFLDPALLPPTSQTERLIALRQVADRLVTRPFLSERGGRGLGSQTADDEPPGSLLGLIRTRNGLIKIDRPADFWAGGTAPDWVAEWGRDSFGAWVILRVGDVTQRLRWIPPGRFQMGSPEGEEGRDSDEGPQHEETIPSGFWMFDTPCTQALWEAVMGENPSRYKGPDRPVEGVSWDQCQEFLQRLNARCTDLELKLPSEAQWEYACRAGRETPRYREDLNEIAWYWENSQGETHPVGQKDPNDWGLYDTLGNVWEWCEDVWTEDYNKEKEARAPRAASAHRVVRGGSWSNVARHVRRVPVPPRALAPGPLPGLSLCRVQDSGTGRSERETGSGASGGARRSGCGAPRRPRPGERSGLDQRRCGGNGCRGVRDAGACSGAFGRRASHAPDDAPPLLGFRHRSGPVWALGGVHDRGASWKAAQEKRGQEEERPVASSTRIRPPAPPMDPAGAVPDGVTRRRRRSRLG